MHVPDPHAIDASGPAPLLRALTVQSSVERVLTAWCDPAVQAVLFAGAAELVEIGTAASRWRLNAPLGQHPVVSLRSQRRSDVLVQQVIQGEDGELASTWLIARPCLHRDGVEVELRVRYAPDGLVERMLTRLLDPAPAVLAGQVLRRLRAWLESGEVPTLQSNPAAR